jgi:hypothetical protein
VYSIQPSSHISLLLLQNGNTKALRNAVILISSYVLVAIPSAIALQSLSTERVYARLQDSCADSRYHMITRFLAIVEKCQQL